MLRPAVGPSVPLLAPHSRNPMHCPVVPRSGPAFAKPFAAGMTAATGPRLRRNPAVAAEREFESMRTAYRPTGGLSPVGEFVDLFRHQQGPTPDTLANWIERRRVICFEWNEGIWLPWFQFHRVALVPHPQLAAVYSALTPVFNGWEMASWFAQPNSWLAGRSPVDTLLSDLAAVSDAARADRFIADG